MSYESDQTFASILAVLQALTPFAELICTGLGVVYIAKKIARLDRLLKPIGEKIGIEMSDSIEKILEVNRDNIV